jgi:hypothetical protein
MLFHHIHTLLSQLVVHWIVMLLHLICTLHLRHMHILHLNMFTLEVVTTHAEEKTPHIQLKLRQGRRKEMSGPMAMRKIWYFSISSSRCPSFDYYVVLTE